MCLDYAFLSQTGFYSDYLYPYKHNYYRLADRGSVTAVFSTLRVLLILCSPTEKATKSKPSLNV